MSTLGGGHQNGHFDTQSNQRPDSITPSVLQMSHSSPEQQWQQLHPSREESGAARNSTTQSGSSSALSSSAMSSPSNPASIPHDKPDVKMEDEGDDQDTMVDASTGPVRSSNQKGNSKTSQDGSGKGPIAAPVKAACTFCRSRKSRCNGKQPCAACINRGQTDDCIYTVSRRGGKPKPKTEKMEPLESHLEKLFSLSDLPHMVRVPNAVPQLRDFQQPIPQQQAESSQMGANGGQGPQFWGSQATSAPFQNLDPSQYAPSGGAQHLGQSQPGPSTIQMQTDPSGQSNTLQAQEPPSSKSLLLDYYQNLYRFIPVLPGPSYLDQLSSSMPPDSPFLLALQTILPLLKDDEADSMDGYSREPAYFTKDRKAALRERALQNERKASQAIDAVLEKAEGQFSTDGSLEIQTLEVIQALCVVTIYEYGSGRALKARLKADQALGLAMSKGLHRLTSTSTGSSISSPKSNYRPRATSAGGGAAEGSNHFLSSIPEQEMHEVRKRLWWTLWSLVLWTAYNSGRIPTIRADDPRVRSELPYCKDEQGWASSVRSLQALLLVQDRVLALSHLEHGEDGDDSPISNPAFSPNASFSGNLHSQLPFSGPPPLQSVGTPHSSTTASSEVPSSFSSLPTMASKQDILASMLQIDAALQEQISALESGDGLKHLLGSRSRTSTLDSAEDDLIAYLHTSAAIQLYTSSLTLHIGQAFQGASLFERKLCFLSSVGETNDSAACQTPMPNAFLDDLGAGATGSWMTDQQPLSIEPEQNLYARGPFLPRQSLQRCVHASKKLLEISRLSRGAVSSPNPFNACSFVLISFVCLMQALAISGNTQDDAAGEEGSSQPTGQTFVDQTLAPSFSRELLASAQGAAALSPAISSGLQAKDSSTFRQERLQQIWERVKEARDTLRGLSKHWDMVIPMADEVGGCLEASQLLLSQQL